MLSSVGWCGSDVVEREKEMQRLACRGQLCETAAAKSSDVNKPSLNLDMAK